MNKGGKREEKKIRSLRKNPSSKVHPFIHFFKLCDYI
jgi:hypothetical protein